MNHYVMSFDHNTWVCSCSAENTYSGESGAQVTCQGCDSFLYIPFMPSLTIDVGLPPASTVTFEGITVTTVPLAEARKPEPPPKGPEIWGLPQEERVALERWLALLMHPRGGVPDRNLKPEEREPLASLVERGALVLDERGLYRAGHPETWGEAVQAAVYDRGVSSPT